ncbi:hypothetical protein [Arcanobacterium pinnipediorum]|uniref:Abi-like protein n=1 Tax=Arcanobacterium pinnipediorum TaxID=1503041 RepID=A0ABY5AFP8_9ACTO|nr:hypothetical protein [Arcanobacterium pinnipediorum]USR79024.1 hypothetical protein NG665_06430 [Arcanobacterium pinnipediorum]
MADTKPFKCYAAQVNLLRERGMYIEDNDLAQRTLERVNYYRLSGYWYPLRAPSSENRG